MKKTSTNTIIYYGACLVTGFMMAVAYAAGVSEGHEQFLNGFIEATKTVKSLPTEKTEE